MAAILTVLAWSALAAGQTAQRSPHIGYVYPAGGQQGQVVQVLVGGQFLRGVSEVHISGQGITAKVIHHFAPTRNLSAEQRQLIRDRMADLFRQRQRGEADTEPAAAEPDSPRKAGQRKKGPASKAPAAATQPPKTQIAKAKAPPAATAQSAQEVNTKGKGAQPEAASQPAQMPDLPLLWRLEDKTLAELQHVRAEMQRARKKQQNAQLDEAVLVELKIAPDAELGPRQLRLVGRMGLTNPMTIEVGPLKEARELEPNDPGTGLGTQTVHELPILLNGQIMPGDVDRFRFRAAKGQQLVIQVHARSLVPFLADAVPGWFQATIALFNDKGVELAYQDDYRFDPDPVLMFKVSEDGMYELQIRDAIYRGRDDFVYRVWISQQPFITRMFPLGGREGEPLTASLDGWNLPQRQLTLDTATGDRIRQVGLNGAKRWSNRVRYEVARLPESVEVEPNDSPAATGRLSLPTIVNGTIAKPGDVDVYAFEAKAGDEVVAEVTARRLGSPLDSLLRLKDTSGATLTWNDDAEAKQGQVRTDRGELTHHADSYLLAKIPADGVYAVHLSDAQAQGSPAHAYRLRIGPPQGDFELLACPSSLNIVPGMAAPLTVYAVRRDGFDGPITLSLRGGPEGFSLAGGTIPSGSSSVRLTVTAPRSRLDRPVALRIEGTATIAGEAVVRTAGPADDQMQAFLYEHLVRADELLVASAGGRGPPLELATSGPVQIAPGQSALVKVRRPGGVRFGQGRGVANVDFKLSQPPPGISLDSVRADEDGWTLQLRAEQGLSNPFPSHLIIEVQADIQRPGGAAKRPNQPQRISVGFLPAIPIQIAPL